MKLSSVLLALPLAVSALVSLEPREPQRSSDSGPPQIRKDAQKKFFKFGPYSLKGATTGKNGGGAGGLLGGIGGMMGEADAQSFLLTTTGSSFCGSCTVLSGQIQIRYMDGTPANVSNGIYVHHILTTGMKSQPNFVRSCQTMPGPGFVGAGDDNGATPFVYASKDNSFESGFWIAPTDRFMAQIVLVNYNKEPKQVQVWYDLEYMPGHVGKSVKSSLIPASCVSIKTSKTAAVNTTSNPMPFIEDGNIVLAKGHLHDGGVAMHLRVNRKAGGQFACTSKATYGGKIHGSNTQTISDMTDCNAKPIKVSAGDTMIMISEYDLKTHPLRETTGHGEAGVMGLFRIIFAPDKNW